MENLEEISPADNQKNQKSTKNPDSPAFPLQQRSENNRKNPENNRYKQSLSSELMQELRKKFQNSLSKLSVTDTREIALQEAKKLIERNNSQEALKIYINSLSELKKSKNPFSRVFEVYLLGYLSEVYKEKLIDESIPLRMLIKIAEAIQSYFKDLNKKVQESAADAFCSLYKNSLPKESQQIVFSFMFEPLHSILTSGIDTQAQQTAALAIFKWASILVEEKENINLITLYNRTLNLFLKLRAEYENLISALGLMIENCKFQPVIDSLNSLLNKILLYIKHPSPTSQSLKLEACKLLAYIGKHLCDTGYLDLDIVPVEVFNALKELRTEKMPLLQSTARETLKIWKNYSNFLSEKHAPFTEKIEKTNENSFNHFKVIRNLINIQKEKSKSVKTSAKEENSWGANKNGFLRRGTGTYSIIEDNGLINIKKALENRPSIKEFIQKNPNEDPRRSVTILYKENSKVNIYERSHIFEVQDLKNNYEEMVFFKNKEKETKRHVEDVRGSNEKYLLKKKNKSEPFALVEAENDGNKKIFNNFEFFDHKNSPETKKFENLMDFKDLGHEFQDKNNQNQIKNDKSNEFIIRKKNHTKTAQELISNKPSQNEFKNEILKVLNDSNSPKNSNNGYIIKKKNSTPKDFVSTSSLKTSQNEFVIKKNISKEFEDPVSLKKSNEKVQSKEKILKNEDDMNNEFILKKKNLPETPKDQLLSTKKESMNHKIEEKDSNFPIKNANLYKHKNLNRKNSLKLDIHKIESIQIQPLNSAKEAKGKLLNQNNFDIHSPNHPINIHPQLKLQKNFSAYKYSSKEIQTSQNFSVCSAKLRENSEKKAKNPSKKFFFLIKTRISLFQTDINKKFKKMQKKLGIYENRLLWSQNSINSLNKIRKSIKKTKSLQTDTNIKPFNQRPEFFQSKNVNNSISRKNSNLSVYSNENLSKNDQNKDFFYDSLIISWKQAVDFYNEGNLSAAFEKILNTGDDLYLLRLMYYTSPCFNRINDSISLQVLQKLAGIIQSSFIQNIGVEWFEQAGFSRIFKNSEDLEQFVNDSE